MVSKPLLTNPFFSTRLKLFRLPRPRNKTAQKWDCARPCVKLLTFPTSWYQLWLPKPGCLKNVGTSIYIYIYHSEFASWNRRGPHHTPRDILQPTSGHRLKIKLFHGDHGNKTIDVKGPLVSFGHHVHEDFPHISIIPHILTKKLPVSWKKMDDAFHRIRHLQADVTWMWLHAKDRPEAFTGSEAA